MKIFGHPVHMMLIHFPSALFPMECVCYALFYFTAKETFGEASFYAMVGGAAMGWLAVILGALDLIKIPAAKSQVLMWGMVHGGMNTTVLIIYTVFAFIAFKKYPELGQADIWILVTKIAVILVMLGANYIGGTLVLKYKVGVHE